MKPREKAVQLLQEMYKNGSTDSCEVYRENSAKRTALIAVYEIIKVLKDDNFYISGETNANEIIDYWQQVKTEIENM